MLEEDQAKSQFQLEEKRKRKENDTMLSFCSKVADFHFDPISFIVSKVSWRNIDKRKLTP